MRISDWSSDVCSSDLRRDCGTGHKKSPERRNRSGLLLPPPRRVRIDREGIVSAFARCSAKQDQPVQELAGGRRSGLRPRRLSGIALYTRDQNPSGAYPRPTAGTLRCPLRSWPAPHVISAEHPSVRPSLLRISYSFFFFTILLLTLFIFFFYFL